MLEHSLSLRQPYRLAAVRYPNEQESGDESESDVLHVVLDELRPERVPVKRAKALPAASSNPPSAIAAIPGEEQGSVGGSVGCEEEVVGEICRGNLSDKKIAGDDIEGVGGNAGGEVCGGGEGMVELDKEEERGAVADGVPSVSSNRDCDGGVSSGPVLSSTVPSAGSSTVPSAGSSIVPSTVPDATCDPNTGLVSSSTPGTSATPEPCSVPQADAVAITEASDGSKHVDGSPKASAVSKVRIGLCPSGTSSAGAVLEAPSTTAIGVSCGDIGSSNPGDATSISSSSIIPNSVKISRTDTSVRSSADAGNPNDEARSSPRDGAVSRSEAIAADMAVSKAANEATTALAAESYFSLFSRPQQATGASASTSNVGSEIAMVSGEDLTGVEGAGPNGAREVGKDCDD